MNPNEKQESGSTSGAQTVPAGNQTAPRSEVGSRTAKDVAVQATLDELFAGAGQSPVRLDRMLESLRSAEFDIASGVAELVDNSVEEGAKNVWIFVKSGKREFRGKAIDVVNELAVVDDGGGMAPEILARCLVLGDTLRSPKSNGRLGIGKFGVGLTMGSISLARRIEIYSRADKKLPFRYTLLDLDLVKTGKQQVIPDPVKKDPPQEYADLLASGTGTVVVLTECDRLQTDPVEKEKGIAASEQIAGLPTFLGRTYRKFIQAGRDLWLNGEQIHLHDPLYVEGPTVWDAKNPETPDLKAKVWGKRVNVPLEIPGSGGQMANVSIRMSLLPREWRPNAGAGNSSFVKARKINDNEGVSILRADREVLYGPVPYIIGARGRAKFLEIDRWWGCEIAFPPELDEYFHVRYIKRGAEPVPSLRDKIRAEIAPSVDALRKLIQGDFEKAKKAKEKESGVFAEAEEAMAKVDATLPRGKSGEEKSAEEAGRELEAIVVATSEVDGSEKPREQRKRELESKPYAIVPVRYPSTVFFEPLYQPGRVIVMLNVDHPFYKQVFEPLCGTVEAMDEDSPVDTGADTPDKRLARKAFMLLLMSYAHAEGFFPQHKDLLANLRGQWGITLGTALAE